MGHEQIICQGKNSKDFISMIEFQSIYKQTRLLLMGIVMIYRGVNALRASFLFTMEHLILAHLES
jgi:hypothetical protein